MRLHDELTKAGERYRITFVPEPICWTEVPTDLRTLKTQRARWQRGLSESLWMHRGLLFRRNAGLVAWVGMPFTILVEWLAPVIEVVGYAYMIVGLVLGFVDIEVMAIFLAVAVGFGTLLSVMGLVLEEMSFKVYSSAGQVLRLFGAALVENFGGRQLMSLFRVIGMFQWIFGRRRTWGEMRRDAPWSPGEPDETPIADKV